ncbi:MAG: ECF transporter S component [Candidatus Aphodomorpha sp.]
MKDNTIQKLAKAGLLAAMIFLLTAVVSIPIPGGAGYINLGDAGVLTAAALLGGWWGAACAGIGSALADLFLGFGVYAPATLVIKGGMALLAAFLLKKMPKKLSVVALLLSALLVPVGYFVYESLLYGVPSAWVNVGFNTMQCIVGALVAQVLIAAIHVATGTGKKD